MNLRRLLEVREYAHRPTGPAPGAREVESVVRVCRGSNGELRDWLVEVLPVAIVAEVEAVLTRLSAPGGADPDDWRRMASLLDAAASARATTAWWTLQPSEPPDPLTALRTRHTWEADLPRAVEAATADEPLALILLDLDHFKQVNDTYGHLVGDEVLGAVGALLRQVVGHRGHAYRWGGEELAVLLPNAEAAEVQALAARVLRRMRELQFSAADLRITASIGWAVLPSAAVSVGADLTSVADVRLYEAKHAGRDLVWDPSMPRGGRQRTPARPAERAMAPNTPARPLDPYADTRIALQALVARVTRGTRSTTAGARLFSSVRYPGLDREEYGRRIGALGALAENDVVDFENARTGRCAGEYVTIKEIHDDVVVLELPPAGGRPVRVHLQFLDPPWEHAEHEIGLRIQGTIIVPEERSAFLWLDTSHK